MEYFGTDLSDHGHYRFVLQDNVMQKNWRDFKDLPFHPESLTNNLPKGSVIFYQGGGFTVLGISGSCKDERGGTKSIFWLKEVLTFEEIKQRILDTPIAVRMINKMIFYVKW